MTATTKAPEWETTTEITTETEVGVIHPHTGAIGFRGVKWERGSPILYGPVLRYHSSRVVSPGADEIERQEQLRSGLLPRNEILADE